MSLDNIITNIQFFHQAILNIYQSDINVTEKWKEIATYMHTNHETITKIFNVLKTNENRQLITIDYSIDPKILEKQIMEEMDILRKISLIILSLHNMVYQLMSTEGNYYFSLKGEEEMIVLKKKKKPIIYYINISNKNEKNIYFHAFILQYSLESLFNKRFYVGVDFEYTNKKIQMAQLNFEHSVVLQSIIMIVSPNELEPIMMENFINLIICNKFIKKILHGSDSLDIPYVYNHMLNNDPKKIIKFTKSLIDTRFLCEYYKLGRNGSDYRCSIYDEDPAGSAVYYFKVIDEEQQVKLTELLQSMPSHYDIVWNIHKLPKSQVLYAQYDVIFLKYFYYQIIYTATKEVATDLEKKNIITLYKHVLNEMTQFIYLEKIIHLEKNNISFLLVAKCKEEVDPVNNYFIRKPNNIIKMIDIYNEVSANLESFNPKVSINNLVKITNFKTPILTIIKRMVYGHISNKCHVYKNKSTIWTDKLDNQFIFDFFSKLKFTYLLNMFKDINKTLEIRINAICSQ